ncbi:hypothetical protein H4R34_003911 [Dimargaris verticillata]|uniref:RRM domain-containing protein n=1 Tax=Dimargaris verticillata TaxID=2761393 RepID=A0A9W8AZZ1_9FUNG|nr:hypothetical protein H4R34_003911 [Dimargaris verticillata]
MNQAYGGNMMGNNQPQAVGMPTRTIYLGNIPPNTTHQKLFNAIRGGMIEKLHFLPAKSCAFVTFMDIAGSMTFFQRAMVRPPSIDGTMLRVGWGRPANTNWATLVATIKGATRCVYIGGLADDNHERITEATSEFGTVEKIRSFPDRDFTFVYFADVQSAIKCVEGLPLKEGWDQYRIQFGKDRCTIQHPEEVMKAVAESNGNIMELYMENVDNILLDINGMPATNRTVYLGNIAPDTTPEDLCNRIHAGMLHEIHYIADKGMAFITFVDSISAAKFLESCAHGEGMYVKGRRLHYGWGKPSPLPAPVATAILQGASRNVYVGGLTDQFTVEKLQEDFSTFGKLEQVSIFPEKSFGFVNFMRVADAVVAVNTVRTSMPEYSDLRLSYGKDRCASQKPPRRSHQNYGGHQHHQQRSSSVLSRQGGDDYDNDRASTGDAPHVAE